MAFYQGQTAQAGLLCSRFPRRHRIVIHSNSTGNGVLRYMPLLQRSRDRQAETLTGPAFVFDTIWLAQQRGPKQKRFAPFLSACSGAAVCAASTSSCSAQHTLALWPLSQVSEGTVETLEAFLPTPIRPPPSRLCSIYA